MKILILFFLLLTLQSLRCQSSKPVFHLEVTSPFDDNSSLEGYVIRFTNDNWTTIEYIMSTSDLSDENTGTWVPYTRKIFMLEENNCENAIKFAKQFNTYEKAHEYNLKIKKLHDDLLKYRNEHRILKKPNKVAQCGTTQIY